jgi:small GTP-binding protein
MNELSKKIILIGNVNVGKTSMVARYVYQRFSDQYISTIGVRIDKKIIQIEDTQLNLILWDLAGESNQQNTPQSYFLGTGGIIYVVDLSSPPTFLNMEDDIEFLKGKIPNVPIIIAANKADKLTPEQQQTNVKLMPIHPDFITSVKDNKNVDDLFDKLGKNLIAAANL